MRSFACTSADEAYDDDVDSAGRVEGKGKGKRGDGNEKGNSKMQTAGKGKLSGKWCGFQDVGHRAAACAKKEHCLDKNRKGKGRKQIHEVAAEKTIATWGRSTCVRSGPPRVNCTIVTPTTCGKTLSRCTAPRSPAIEDAGSRQHRHRSETSSRDFRRKSRHDRSNKPQSPPQDIRPEARLRSNHVRQRHLGELAEQARRALVRGFARCRSAD